MGRQQKADRVASDQTQREQARIPVRQPLPPNRLEPRQGIVLTCISPASDPWTGATTGFFQTYKKDPSSTGFPQRMIPTTEAPKKIVNRSKTRWAAPGTYSWVMHIDGEWQLLQPEPSSACVSSSSSSSAPSSASGGSSGVTGSGSGGSSCGCVTVVTAVSCIGGSLNVTYGQAKGCC